MTMRKVLRLYYSYMKTSIISMLAAAIVLPLYAAVFTRKLSPVLGITFFSGILVLAYWTYLRFFSRRLIPVKSRKVNQSTRPTGLQESKGVSKSAEQVDSSPKHEPEAPVNVLRTQEIEKPLRFMDRESREREKLEGAIINEALRNIDIDATDSGVASPSLNLSLVRPPTESASSAKIKVVGIGGGGSNAVSWMVDMGVVGVEFLAVNTDIQALKHTRAHRKLQIGAVLTRGLGVGGDPNLGRQAALEDTKMIVDALKGIDMVFLTAGLGGGTGTGAIPIFAKIARELGILTVAVITKPFGFEGHRRQRQAEEG